MSWERHSSRPCLLRLHLTAAGKRYQPLLAGKSALITAAHVSFGIDTGWTNHRNAHIFHHFSPLQCVVLRLIYPANAALESRSASWLEGGGQHLCELPRTWLYLLVFSDENTQSYLTLTSPHPLPPVIRGSSPCQWCEMRLHPPAVNQPIGIM